MASIEKRQNKSGVSYRLIVDFIDTETNSRIRKSKTWRVPDDMDLKLAQRKAQELADQFENEIKDDMLFGLEQSDYTVEQYSKIYLEYVRKTSAVSTYVRTKQVFEYINDKIGNIKLAKLNPATIQKYFDSVDEDKKIEETIYPKSNFNETLEAHGFNYHNLRREYGVQHFTLRKAMDLKNVERVWVDKFLAKVNLKFSQLFYTKIEESEFAFNTKKKRKTYLRQMLAYAKRQRIIKENYATSDFVVYSKDTNKHELETMNEEQAKKFYETLLTYPDIRVRTSLLVFLLTGFRRSEVVALTWDNVDFKKNKIKVERVAVYVSTYGVILKEPKTSKSQRSITMPTILVDALREYKAWQDIEKKKLQDYYKDENWLFTRDNGEMISPDTFLQWLRKVLDKADLPKFTLHSLRHTNITLQIAAGIPLVTVAGRAGHSRTSTTTDIYSHFLNTSDAEAAEKIDSLFEGKEKESELEQLIKLKETLTRLGINDLSALSKLL